VSSSTSIHQYSTFQVSKLGEDRMPDTNECTSLKQPWKAHWPPKKAYEGQLIAFGYRKGERITIDGNGGGGTGNVGVKLGDPNPIKEK
jgi:hypothetical protein